VAPLSFLLGAFALVAVALAAVGIYRVLAPSRHRSAAETTLIER
jgi:hypothetical protein